MLYLFYPQRSDGTASLFEASDLTDTASAITHARGVLGAHDSATEVAVWCDDILIAVVTPDAVTFASGDVRRGPETGRAR